MGSIIILAAGTLLLGNNHAFRQVYGSIHKPIQEDAKVITAAFGGIARKSNRINYTLYEITGGYFAEAVPEMGETIATGQAVEFRYWDQPFYELRQGMEKMEVSDTGSKYALFYLVDEVLYIDYGDVVNGIAGIDNGTRKTTNIVTQQLTEKVDITSRTDIFSHEIVGGAGSGCVSLNLTLTNDDGDIKNIKMASLLRVVWPQ